MDTRKLGKWNIVLILLAVLLGAYCLFGPGPLLRLRESPSAPEEAPPEEDESAALRAELDSLSERLAAAEAEKASLQAELDRLAPFLSAAEADREAEAEYVLGLERQLSRMSEEERIANSYTLTPGQHSTAGHNWNYWIYDPNLPGRKEPLPMVVYLHGTRGTGFDPELLVRYDPGLGTYIREGKIAVNALILLPQSDSSWTQDYDELAELIRWAVEHYGADPDRVSLVGCSAGGIACFEMLERYDDLFCCCAAIGASTDPEAAAQIKTPLRIYHGKNDYHMGFSVMEASELINENGGSAELIMMERTWHNEQLVLYESEWGLWEWVLAQKR